MRKILSKEEEAKKARRNQLLIGGAMVLIMVASVLGYSLSREQTTTGNDKIIYNGLEFTKQSGFWGVNIDSYQFFFKYNPQETKKINSALNPLKNYADKPLYIYSDNLEASSEIYRNLFYQNRIVERVNPACIEGEKCEENDPVKTCENNFIVVRESNITEVEQEQNCVFISGNMENLTMLSDEFLFKIIGVQ